MTEENTCHIFKGPLQGNAVEACQRYIFNYAIVSRCDHGVDAQMDPGYDSILPEQIPQLFILPLIYLEICMQLREYNQYTLPVNYDRNIYPIPTNIPEV